jgi:Cu+-exporting ATPase
MVREIRLEVRGMHCAGCVARVEKALRSVPGVDDAQVNLVTQRAVVHTSNESLQTQPLVQAVAAAGYEAVPLEDSSEEVEGEESASSSPWSREAEEQKTRLRQLAVGCVGLIVILATMLVPGVAATFSAWPAIIAATIVQLYLGAVYASSAWKQLRHGGVSMDTLIAAGTWTAYLAGIGEAFGGWSLAGHVSTSAHPGGKLFLPVLPMYLNDAAMILTFITLGKYLEVRARFRASLAIRRLMDLSPSFARVIRGESVQEVSVRKVQVGDHVRVLPGEKIPLDGLVVAGESEIDESWLTGESVPVARTVGQEVFAGTLNLTGPITIRVTKPARQTLLAQVVRMVEHAQETRPRLGRLADRVVAWFVPGVLITAAATFVIWGFVVGEWRMALSTTVAVLVVACPCALGLATPTAIVVASGRAASHGILVRDAQALESAAFVNTVVLDKTGTVTVGRPQLVEIRPAPGHTEEELLQVAATAEQLSLHPVARAVLEEVRQRGLTFPTARSIEVLPGQGIRVESDGHTIVIQSLDLADRLAGKSAAVIGAGAEENDVEGEMAAVGAKSSAMVVGSGSRIVVSVLRDGELFGVLEFADLPAEESREAIATLQQMGLQIIMLTGDREETARAVAEQLGIRDFEAGLTPPQKHERIRELRQAGHCVAMVGDGINDAAALAEADVGIALSHGADIAKEAAAIVLIGRGLLAVVDVLRLGRATVRTIRRNLFWAFAYNVVLIPLAAGIMYPWTGILIPPAAAAAAMAASSVSVVLSSLMLGRAVVDRPSRPGYTEL